MVIGLVMSSTFAALVVSQEVVHGRVGLGSGLMFEVMLGSGGIGAAGRGRLADLHGMGWGIGVVSFLPLLPGTRAKA